MVSYYREIYVKPGRTIYRKGPKRTEKDRKGTEKDRKGTEKDREGQKTGQEMT